jgi:hypothetical protein
MSSRSTRPPNPGDDAVSSLWLGVRFLVIAPLLPAGPDEGGVAAVFRGPGVQATTMPDGNDREHDGHHRMVGTFIAALTPRPGVRTISP